MYKQGTVVLTPFPFTDLTEAKVRPAVIVSNGKVGRDVIVVFLTTQTKRNKYSCVVKPTKLNGLKQTSILITSKLATLDTKVILGELGMLDVEDIDLVIKKLKMLF